MTSMQTNDPMAALRQAYAERGAAATRARAAGIPVVAYLGNATPVELILAAGAFPVQMTGDPGGSTPLAEQYLDDDFDADLRSVFQRIVSGFYNAADLIIIPRSSNGYLYLYYFLLEVSRLLPQQRFPEVVLFDALQTPFWSTGHYVHGRMLDLIARLERLAGRAIGEVHLAEAIATKNRSRAALQMLNDLRRAGRVGGAEVLCAIGASECIEYSISTALVRTLADRCAESEPRAGVRLMVKGAPHDSLDFYQLVESLGAVVVADDHVSGERSIEHLVDETIDPLAALVQHYHLHAPGIRSFPQAKQDARFIEIVEDAAVQGVIFFHDEFDDTLGWDYPEQKKLLDARGIPSAFLQQQAYRTPNREAQRAAIVDLLERSRP